MIINIGLVIFKILFFGTLAMYFFQPLARPLGLLAHDFKSYFCLLGCEERQNVFRNTMSGSVLLFSWIWFYTQYKANKCYIFCSVVITWQIVFWNNTWLLKFSPCSYAYLYIKEQPVLYCTLHAQLLKAWSCHLPLLL